MTDRKSIDEILSLTDEIYAIYANKLIKEKDAIYKVDELDDQLLKMVETRPGDVERICRINSIVFATVEEDEIRSFVLVL